MQLCGARGGGQAASRALYWVANKSHSLMLVLESERERNAAILLARRFARDQNVCELPLDTNPGLSRNEAMSLASIRELSIPQLTINLLI